MFLDVLYLSPHLSIFQSGPALTIQIMWSLQHPVNLIQLLLNCMVLELEPSSHGYSLLHVFTSIHWILRGRLHWLQSKHLKRKENIFYFSCLGPGWAQNLSVPNLLPCHASHHTSHYGFCVCLVIMGFTVIMAR